MPSVMSEEEREMWRKTNEIALAAIKDKPLGDELRAKAETLASSGKYQNKFDALHAILLGMVKEKEKR